MAAKNSVKIYAPNCYYHLYNRGVAKSNIFQEEFDFSVFLSYLKAYLSLKDVAALNAILASPKAGYKEKYNADKLLRLKNFYANIELLAYVLLPNHFHFLIWQKEPESIDRFMNAIGTRYAGFFNRKYHRVGPIYQGVYKAVTIKTEEQLIHVSRYIHLNPPVRSNFPSSLPEYLGKRNTTWINTKHVLSYFNKKGETNSYQDFMGQSMSSEIIYPLSIDFGED